MGDEDAIKDNLPDTSVTRMRSSSTFSYIEVDDGKIHKFTGGPITMYVSIPPRRTQMLRLIELERSETRKGQLEPIYGKHSCFMGNDVFSVSFTTQHATLFIERSDPVPDFKHTKQGNPAPDDWNCRWGTRHADAWSKILFHIILECVDASFPDAPGMEAKSVQAACQKVYDLCIRRRGPESDYNVTLDALSVQAHEKVPENEAKEVGVEVCVVPMEKCQAAPCSSPVFSGPPK
jgi:hypothetical protein